jgi:hypothetical protein
VTNPRGPSRAIHGSDLCSHWFLRSAHKDQV